MIRSLNDAVNVLGYLFVNIGIISIIFQYF